ncbi:spindle and kinetochore-associated protein 3-like [Myxocyprinus asiaticus]|uniref:spindle and kinetochore-associated protein 3-like n=1 Tax=Myxocyprinus asiaticus TaxID=70543 RepID=UPI002223256A|nr:spindle and kinetochore-associated protein 3-like [Myxocyprinus asiaticus]
MNPSERFFAKLRKLTVYLETESNSLLHASQNLKDDDEDEENGAQALYQLCSEVRALKRQVQDQVATHDASSTELRSFIRKCLVLKQRTTEDIDRLKKHYEKYGYRPQKARPGNTKMHSTKEVEEQAERELEKTDEAQEDEEMGQVICEEGQESETPEKMPPPSVDQLRTPKLSDFGLSALHFQRVVGEADPPQSIGPVPAVALSPPPFVMNLQPPQPKCSLRMDKDALTPRLEDFGISEDTMCWNNDFTMDLFSKKPPKASSKTMEKDQKPPHVFSTVSAVPNNGVANESLESPDPPVFCTPGFKIEKHRVPSSPPLDRQKNLDSPPHPNNCPSTPEFPTFETPFVSKLLKKQAIEEESGRHRGLLEGSFLLPDVSNTNRAPSFDVSEMPKILSYEEEAMPEMPTLHSHFGSSLASKPASGEILPGKKMGAGNVLDLNQAPVPLLDGHNQDWCLSTPKMRMRFHTEPCTPEMPDISSVTQDILKLVAQCKS